MRSFQRLTLLSFFILGFSKQVFAVGSTGFENASFSPKALGQSNAVVAQADEPAAISYNPAGIAYLSGVQVESAATPISIFTQYRNTTTDDIKKSSGTAALVPTAYATVNPGEIFNDRIVFGIGSDSPFGLSNKYDSTHPISRYTGHRNWLKMYTLKPTLAVKLADWISIGGGPVYYRIFDFGQILQYPNTLISAGALDGQMRLNASGTSWGWQFGTLLKPHEKHHFGFYFRSPTHMMVKGQAKVENSAFSGAYETGIHAKMTLPLNMTWGYAFHPNKKTTFEVDFGYTHWSIHEHLNVVFDPTSNALDNTINNALGPNPKDFRDSFSIHLGAKRKVTQKLDLMAGSLFYTAATPKDHFTPAVPDSNRLAFSLGSSYQITENIAVDATYMAMFGLRRHINNSISEALGTSVDGRYFSYYQIISVALRLKWDNLFGSHTKLESNSSEEIIPSPNEQPIMHEDSPKTQAMDEELSNLDLVK